MQKPPMYSAVKVDGKRLYKYARQGKEVDIPDREIHISKFELLDIDGPKADFLITVSKGTYIRSLILDLAVKLNTTAVVTEIFRTNIGKLSIEYPEYIRDINTLESTTEPVSIHWSKILDLPVVEIDDLIYKKNLPSNTSSRSLYNIAEKIRYEALGGKMLKGIQKNFVENYNQIISLKRKDQLKSKTSEEISKTTSGLGIPGFKWPL